MYRKLLTTTLAAAGILAATAAANADWVFDPVTGNYLACPIGARFIQYVWNGYAYVPWCF